MYFKHEKLFRQFGWDCTFFSMQHAENVKCPTESSFALPVHYGSSGSLRDNIIGASRVIYSFDAKRRLHSLLNSTDVTIAHFHSVYHHLSPSVLQETHGRGIPTVLTAHELKLACPAYKMMTSDGICERCKGGRVWNVAAHKCIKNSSVASSLVMVESMVHKALNLYDRFLDAIITPSVFYREKLIEWGWNPEKLIFIPNFVDLNEFTPRSSNCNERYFLYFGRLAPEKGLKTLIRASALSRIAVKIVGSGPEEISLKTFAASLSAPVEFISFKSGVELKELVRNARANVLCSEWYENAPMSIMEAFAEGKPTIGAKIGGIPELIHEGVTGWTFESGDHLELSARLEAVMEMSDSFLDDMGMEIRAFAESRFSGAGYYHAMNSLYETLLERK